MSLSKQNKNKHPKKLELIEMPYFILRALGSNGIFQLGLTHDEDINQPEITFKCWVNPALYGRSDDVDPQTREKLRSRECMLYKLGITSGYVQPSKIACGGNHTVILLSNGMLLGTGLNEQGQLNFNNSSETEAVIKGWKVLYSNTSEPIKDVACTWEATIFLKKIASGEKSFDTEVHSFGTGSKGELGLGQNVKYNTDPYKCVLKLENNTVVSLKASMYNVVLQDKTHSKIYGWGSNTKNQLLQAGTVEGKVPQKFKTIWEPKLISGLGLEILGLGKDFSVSQAKPKLKKNKFLLQFHKSGSMVKQDFETLNSFEEDRYVDSGSMWSSFHVLRKYSFPNNDSTDQDTMSEIVQIHSVGNGGHGQLSMDTKYFYNFKYFSCGSEHGILCNSLEEVYCWGWGEHGNCGVRTKTKSSSENETQDSTVWNDLNLVYKASEAETINFIQGGCATTFISTMMRCCYEKP